MFTGIITAIGRVEDHRRRDAGGRMTIRCPDGWLDDAATGDSIAVDGACLTVAKLRDNYFCADISAETAARCVPWRAQQTVNLESSLAMGGKLGGHFVTGHIDGTAVMADSRADGDSVRQEWRTDRRHLPLIVEKGGVALGGVSLTVNRVGGDFFGVTLVPYTLAHTVFPRLSAGDSVNLETDLVARHIAALLGKRGEIDTMPN